VLSKIWAVSIDDMKWSASTFGQFFHHFFVERSSTKERTRPPPPKKKETIARTTRAREHKQSFNYFAINFTIFKLRSNTGQSPALVARRHPRI
jgi:hypothetical protein